MLNKEFGPKSKSVRSTCDYSQSTMRKAFRHPFTMSPQRIGSRLPSQWMILNKEKTERQHMRGRICNRAGHLEMPLLEWKKSRSA
jgi:hypothetical protein